MATRGLFCEVHEHVLYMICVDDDFLRAFDVWISQFVSCWLALFTKSYKFVCMAVLYQTCTVLRLLHALFPFVEVCFAKLHEDVSYRVLMMIFFAL